MGIVALGSGAAVLIQFSRGESEYRENVSRLAATGVPVDVPSLYARDLGDETVGAQYSKLFADLQGLKLSHRNFPVYETLGNPKIVAAMAPSVRPLIPRLESLTSKDHPSFARKWEQTYAVTFNEVAGFRGLAQFMGGEARIRADAGDLQGCLKALRTIQGLAKHVGGEPVTITQMVGQSIYGIHDRAANYALDRFQDDKGALEALLKHIETRDEPPDLRKSLRAELGMTLIYLNSHETLGISLAEFETGTLDDRKRRMLADSPLVRRAVRHVFAREALVLMDVAASDPGGYGTYLEQRRGELRASTKLVDKITSALLPSHRPGMLEPFLARRRTTLVAAKLLLERHKTGSFPAQLPDWGEIVQDPFSTGKLVYKPTSKGFSVYSVGENKRDDGGNNQKAMDIGAIISDNAK